MSVKVHAPVCEDSAQDLYFFGDHFLGDQLQDEWNFAGTGTGVVVDQQTGGIVRLTTGALATNNVSLNWNNIRSLLVAKKVTIEYRVKIADITSILCHLELNNAGNDRIYFRYDTTVGANWFIVTIAGGAATTQDSGIAADTDYHIFRIECFPTGQVHFYIDGVECANSPITTNITALYLQPRMLNYTREAVAKTMDVDYVVVRQER